jgi:hypothetical protein
MFERRVDICLILADAVLLSDHFRDKRHRLARFLDNDLFGRILFVSRMLLVGYTLVDSRHFGNFRRRPFDDFFHYFRFRWCLLKCWRFNGFNRLSLDRRFDNRFRVRHLVGTHRSCSLRR